MARKVNRRLKKTHHLRKSLRFLPGDIPFFKDLSVIAGPEATLVNASQGGVLIKSESPLVPNSSLLVRFVTEKAAFLLKGTVLRSQVYEIGTRAVVYHTAIAFDGEFSELGSDGNGNPMQKSLFKNTCETATIGPGMEPPPMEKPPAASPGHAVAPAHGAGNPNESATPVVTLTMPPNKLGPLIDLVYRIP